MPDAGIYIRVEAEEVNAMLNRAALALSPESLAAFLEEQTIPFLESRAQERFATESDSTGAWTPLSPSTQKQRQAQGFQPSHPINVRTGDLKNWMTKGSNARALVASGVATLEYPGEAPNLLLETKLGVAQGEAVDDSPSTPARTVAELPPPDAAAILEALSHRLASVIGTSEGGGIGAIEYSDSGSS